jgi:hypothetical protein
MPQLQMHECGKKVGSDADEKMAREKSAQSLWFFTVIGPS